MTTIGKGADLMEVLKKKMRQAKEDTERLKDENEEISRKLQVEVQRREAVVRLGSLSHVSDSFRNQLVIRPVAMPSREQQQPTYSLVLPDGSDRLSSLSYCSLTLKMSPTKKS
ncbi:hypothetical protein Pcinc_028177 [Petrolisthes cinctipes]|uniref:Uncharacterized protein n=1 Tax=Petrolisthes cinctipes TaxID=88211 RepID=A0AAE1F3F1_PETCI|nr:hypothetical protein Pcinc_028177 [Petrolisthes cinctipes]